MTGMIFLAGGGDAQDSFLLDQYFIQSIGSSGRILYIPHANYRQAPHAYADSLTWLQNILQAKLNHLQIELWSGYATDLNQYQAVYLGGGNTYYLRHLLAQSQLDRALVNYYHQGGIIYGGSAGAIVLGNSLQTVANEALSNISTIDHGLGLIQTYSVVCHLNKLTTDDQANLTRLASTVGPILGLTETCGITFAADQFRVISDQPQLFI